MSHCLHSPANHDLVQDPTLDPSPIAHAMPPKDRFVPGFATLATGSLLALILLLIPIAFQGPIRQTIPFNITHVDLSFSEDIFPGINGGGGTEKSPSPGKGLNKPADTQTIAAVQISNKSPLPLSIMDLSFLKDKAPTLPPGLPTGCGLPTGDGLPRAMGHGNGESVGVSGGGSFDYHLVPAFQARASYRLKPGEKGDNTIVEVLVTVEEGGMVTQVKVLSGPEFLYPSVIAAARRWRFEPLSLHGLKGPQQTQIRFFCNIT